MKDPGKLILLFAGLFLMHFAYAQTNNKPASDKVIRPYSENPGYWQYKGKPILLIGGSINDNLFQTGELEEQLNRLQEAGGNYVRNTMSDRDKGNEKAFFKNSEGKFDLNKWNDAYWNKFENLLKFTNERDIIVQIEIWDRFDHSRDEWQSDPYNPKNNINYTYEEAKLDSLYPKHPARNTQAFFFTVPALNNNDLLLHYQKAFVDKILSISLQYGNVLYCMDNETSGKEEWAIFWADYVQRNAEGREMQLTEMWDNWDVKSDVHKRTFDHPYRYSFIDISQNTQITGNENWENAQYVFNYISENKRPVNSTKIYGSDNSWVSRGITHEHAVQTFFRNLIGGFASSRFHRPTHGLGLSKTSVSCIKTVRKIETFVKFWDIDPRMDLLSNNEKGEAYIAAQEGKYYLIYFTDEGDVKLDLSNQKGKYTIHWIDIESAEWIEREKIKAGSIVDIKAKCKNGCVAVIVK